MKKINISLVLLIISFLLALIPLNTESISILLLMVFYNCFHTVMCHIKKPDYSLIFDEKLSKLHNDLDVRFHEQEKLMERGIKVLEDKVSTISYNKINQLVKK